MSFGSWLPSDTWQVSMYRILPSFHLFYEIHLPRQFSTFLKGCFKQLICFFNYIFYCIALSQEFSPLSCKNSLVIFIHNLHYWLQNIALSDIFIQLLLRVFSQKRQQYANFWSFRVIISIFLVRIFLKNVILL